MLLLLQGVLDGPDAQWAVVHCSAEAAMTVPPFRRAEGEPMVIGHLTRCAGADSSKAQAKGDEDG